MKKQNKPYITPEEVIKDFDKIMEFINKIENQDLNKINVEEIENQTEQIKKEIEKKYNPVIDKLKDNLDSKE